MQTRASNSRYTRLIETMTRHSVVSKIIEDELEAFCERATARLNELNLEDYDEDTINVIKEARQDIRIAVAERFGNPVATSCISIARGPDSMEWI